MEYRILATQDWARGLGMGFFCDLHVLNYEETSHPTQVSTQVQLAASSVLPLVRPFNQGFK